MLIHNALYRSTAIPAAAKSLDASVLRGKAISANLANLNTPGYRRIEVEFEGALRTELNRLRENGKKPEGDPAAERAVIAQSQPVAYRPDDRALPGGLNNVDVDIEAAKLAENQLLFQYGVRFIQSEKSMIESAIRGRSA